MHHERFLDRHRLRALVPAFWAILWATPLRAEDAGRAEPNPGELIGQAAPRFILKTLNPELGEARYLLRDHVGSTARKPKTRVLLSFAASWCDPCREELSELKALREPLEAAAVGVAVVIIDNTREGIDTMRKLVVDGLALPFPAVSDRFQVLARRYRVGTLPLSVVINRQGVVEYVQEGSGKAKFARLREALGVPQAPAVSPGNPADTPLP